ncbi:MAG: NTP transferase domain-containing protein [Solirubrobacteraceae bacterium]
MAVLAGGAGRRLGGAKATVSLAGRPLIAYPIAAARAAGLEPVVVAKPGSPLPQLDCGLIEEPTRPSHPACGVLAALDHAAGGPVIALACDMPFIAPELLVWLADLEGAAAACVDGRPQPLLARYLAGDRPALERALRDSAPLHSVLAGARLLNERELERFGEPRLLCFAVNDAADLALAEREIAARSDR